MSETLLECSFQLHGQMFHFRHFFLPRHCASADSKLLVISPPTKMNKGITEQSFCFHISSFLPLLGIQDKCQFHFLHSIRYCNMFLGNKYRMKPHVHWQTCCGYRATSVTDSLCFCCFGQPSIQPFIHPNPIARFL